MEAIDATWKRPFCKGSRNYIAPNQRGELENVKGTWIVET
jgi:hypothetical protein